MRRSLQSKSSSSSHSLHPSRIWKGLVELETVSGELSLIINNFVKERPRKMRGINIDIFLSQQKFELLADEKKLTIPNEDFWIWKRVESTKNSSPARGSALYFLDYGTDFVPGSRRNSSFIIECESRGFCLVSNFRRYHHDKVAAHLIGKIYPDATRAFLTSQQMREILSKANDAERFDLRVRADHSLVEGRGYDSATAYRRRPVDELPGVDEVFETQENIRRYITMCKLKAANRRTPLEMTFSGDGHIGLYDGDFNKVFEQFIQPIIAVSSTRLEDFSDRSMSETDDHIPRQIEFESESEPFSSAKGIEFIRKHIENYRRCTYSVVHSGNPHLYMYVMDSVDYSTFSVRTAGTNRLVITPQVMTSAASMLRFAQHLLSEVGDATIRT